MARSHQCAGQVIMIQVIVAIYQLHGPPIVFTQKVMHEECNVATQGVEVEKTYNANKKYTISNNVP